MNWVRIAGLACFSTLSAAQYDFTLSPGESRQWRVDIAPSDAAWVRIEKSSGDLRLTVKGGGEATPEFRASHFSVAPIEFVVTGDATGHAEINATNPEAPGGPPCAGRLVLGDPHPATERDRTAWDAAQRTVAAEGLERQQGGGSKVRGAWESALSLLSKLGDRYHLANAHGSLASWLARQQDFKEARAEYLLALEAVAGSGWRFEEAVLRQNLASIYSQTGDYVLAMREQAIALEVRKELGDQPGRGIALFGLGITAWRMGAYQDALDYYRQSLALWRGLGERGWQAQVINAMGLLDATLGRPRMAQTRYREANSIWRSLHDERNRAMAVSNEGLLSAQEGDTAEAEQLFREALAIYEKQQNQLGIAYVVQNLGDVAANAGNHSEALELYGRSLQLKDGMGDAKGAASSHTRSGLSYLALKRPADAEREIGKSLEIARRISDREEEAQALGALARVHLRCAALREAEENIEAAIRLIESARLELRERDTRAGYFSTRRDYYDLAMDIAVAQGVGGQERGWMWSERARSRTLLDTLQRAGVDVTNSPETSASFARLRKELLDKDTVLVQYSVSPGRTLAWVIDLSTVRMVRLPGSGALTAALADAAGGKLLPISDAIWKPLQLSGPYKRVIVAPEGGLERVPFAALPCGPDTALADRWEIVNVPSASLLIARRQAHGVSRGAPAIFADAVFSRSDIRVKAGARETSESNALPRLRFTREEGIALARLLGPDAQLAMDFDASRDRLRTAVSSPGPLLHIASHAVLEEDEPGRSRIILSRVTPAGVSIRGDLTLDEIFSLRIRKDLVVLSACSTAGGAEVRGEGVMSFARAFLYAGAKALIATLYTVDDRASSEFVNRFYTAMYSSGESPASALRRAQLEMKADPRWRDPRVWAAFVLFGDWNLRLVR